jgi:hypothetical protein
LKFLGPDQRAELGCFFRAFEARIVELFRDFDDVLCDGVWMALFFLVIPKSVSIYDPLDDFSVLQG